MKKLAIIFVLSFVCTQAFCISITKEIIPFENSQTCLVEVPSLKFKTINDGKFNYDLKFPGKTYLLDAQKVIATMIQFVSAIEHKFIKAKDPAILMDTRPLCIGIEEYYASRLTQTIGTKIILVSDYLISWLGLSFEGEGDAPLKVILAHQYGHLILHRLDVQVSMEMQELLSDCMGAIIVNFHKDQGIDLSGPAKMTKFLSTHDMNEQDLPKRKEAVEAGFKLAKILKNKGQTSSTLTEERILNACKRNYSLE
ncbi:MAG: hypothetical protein AB7I27_19525 [Bacteriovoracaceae bacterium]